MGLMPTLDILKLGNLNDDKSVPLYKAIGTVVWN